MKSTADTPDARPEPSERLVGAIRGGADSDAILSILNDIPTSDVPRALDRMHEADRARVLLTLNAREAAGLIEALPEKQAEAVLCELETADAARIVEELHSDEQADLIAAMPDEKSEAILRALDPADAAAIRSLADYAREVAGGLMVTEFLAYPRAALAETVLDDLRQHADRYRDYDVQYAYVVDDDHRLVGVLRLRDLMLAPPAQPLCELLLADPHRVLDHTPLEDLAEFFDLHRFYGAPVTDEAGRLLGVIRRDDVEEAIAERAGDDYRKSQGIVGGEELRSMPLLRRSRRRLAWLSINIVLNMVAASVIASHQDTLQAAIALAVFLPMISDMSGCSGNQAVAVSMRELTLGLVRPRDLVRVLIKECSVGLINGVVLGALLACVAWIWQGDGMLGLVVGAALAINTVIAVAIGGAVPVVLRGLKLDPALASGPILTTVTDLCGFLLALTLAARLLVPGV